MGPDKALPYSDEFASADDYVDHLLDYVANTPLFQTLCGGVHIMDFYTTDPGLFYSVVPEEWHAYLLGCEPMQLLDFLLRDDIDAVEAAAAVAAVGVADRSGIATEPCIQHPPASLIQYVRDVRRLTLQRGYAKAGAGEAPAAAVKREPPQTLSRLITLGMNVKKVHEVTHFADYVHRLATAVSAKEASSGPGGKEEAAATPTSGITHILDIGSGQNYLGRALASPPYERRVVAVEGRGHNIVGAMDLDVKTGVAAMPPAVRPMRNKKLYQQLVDEQLPPEKQNVKVRHRIERRQKQQQQQQQDKGEGQENEKGTAAAMESVELRPKAEILAEVVASKAVTAAEPLEPDSPIQYVQGRVESGDLSGVLAQVRAPTTPNYLAVSIHSCGNLTHHALRALVLNPSVRAAAIVGCCYNLLTERLGPPTYKLPGMQHRPTLQPVNGRLVRESERRDPEGFPMSQRLGGSTSGGSGRSDRSCGLGCDGNKDGVRLNVTARSMACQAPANWTASDSDTFFTRNYYRAVLQRIFLDRGVLRRVPLEGVDAEAGGAASGAGAAATEALSTAVTPIIVGSLRKACYASLATYVRGAVAKLDSQGNGNGYASAAENAAINAAVAERMGPAALSDADLAAYEVEFAPRKRELSAVWSLMAFSAGVAESLIVTDRWLYLREQQERGLLSACWVESVFEYEQSPRNLVVVGIKA